MQELAPTASRVDPVLQYFWDRPIPLWGKIQINVKATKLKMNCECGSGDIMFLYFQDESAATPQEVRKNADSARPKGAFLHALFVDMSHVGV